MTTLEFAYQLFYAHRDKMLETCKSKSYTWRDSALVTLDFLKLVSTKPDQYWDEVEKHLRIIN